MVSSNLHEPCLISLDVQCSMGYKQCNGDIVFYQHFGRRVVVLGVYVDDIIITGDDEREIIHLKEKSK